MQEKKKKMWKSQAINAQLIIAAFTDIWEVDSFVQKNNDIDTKQNLWSIEVI